jgi:hypothetical protein
MKLEKSDNPAVTSGNFCDDVVSAGRREAKFGLSPGIIPESSFHEESAFHPGGRDFVEGLIRIPSQRHFSDENNAHIAEI